MIKGLLKKVTIHVSKCAISGPPETGKTCLKALLLGLPRPPPDCSTAISTTAEEVTPDVEEETLADQPKISLPDCYRAEQGKSKWGKIERSNWARYIANTIHQKLKNTCGGTPAMAEFVCQSNATPMKGLCKLILTQLKNMPAKTRKRKTMETIRLVYLVDTGGQPQFQEILPNFIRSSINILVHKLSQKLSDYPGFSYNGVRYEVADSMKVSNISIIEQSVRSVCSSVRTTEETNQIIPSIAIVGTFEDEYKKSWPDQNVEEHLRERTREISSHLEHFTSSTQTCRILSYRRNNQIIYPIDGSVSGWSDNSKVVDDLKEIIQNNTGIELTVPIWYIVFLQDIKAEFLHRMKANNARKYFSIDECFKIAEKCLVSPSIEDIEMALKTFNEMNIILYFPESLKDLVFVEPSFLYRIVTDIIVRSFERKDIQSRNFNTTGIITKGFLQDIDSFQSLCGSFTQEHFLKLLMDILIIADIGNDKYFMPCVLPLHAHDEEELKRMEGEMKRQQNIEGPLVISFGDKISPRGLFCSMIVDLQQCFGWKLVEEDQVQKRNRIEFHVSRSDNKHLLGTATIVDKVNCLEVYTTCSSNNCIFVHHTVRNSLFKACQNMKYSPLTLEIEIGLYCNQNQCIDKPRHHTVCSHNQKNWMEKCRSRKSRSIALTSERAVWFSEEKLGKDHYRICAYNISRFRTTILTLSACILAI